jgi:uncharacterized protein YndB with AHSA1/START domain
MTNEAKAASPAPISTTTTGEQFIYTIYIRTTAEKLFAALTQPEFTAAYWGGVTHDTTWKPGSPWALKLPDGRTADAGEVIEYDPPRRIVVSWHHQLSPELNAEGVSRCVIELEPFGESVKLTVVHSLDRHESKFLQAVSTGWPAILSSLKSLHETGEPIAPPKPVLDKK